MNKAANSVLNYVNGILLLVIGCIIALSHFLFGIDREDMLGALSIYISFLFLMGWLVPNNNFVTKIIIFCCENLSWPGGQWMAKVYAVIFLTAGLYIFIG